MQTFWVFPKVHISNYVFPHEYYQKMLSTVPQKAILGCMSDVSCFALWYLQNINQVRPDVLIISQGDVFTNHRLPPDKDYIGADYSQGPEKFIDIISWNMTQRPVYLAELQKYYHDTLGFEYGFVHYLPGSYAGNLTLEADSIQFSPDLDFYERIIAASADQNDLYRLQFRAALAQQQMVAARALSYLQVDSQLIKQRLSLAEELNYPLPDRYREEVQQLAFQVIPSVGYSSYGQLTPPYKPEEVYKQAQIYYDQGNTFMALLGYRAMLYPNPKDLFARLAYARFLKQMGFTQMSAKEYQLVMKLFPHQQELQLEFENLVRD